MKRSLIAASLAAIATVTFAAVQIQTPSGENTFDRSLPTFPELGFDGWRNNAGESEMDNRVQIQLGFADNYRFDAGESTHGLVVQDVGSG
jgi:hypothetical protein